MKSLLKISMLSALLALTSCSHYGRKACCSAAKCEMKKEQCKEGEQCEMKKEGNTQTPEKK